MPTLLLRFPAGRYHATPWGHHVNEGLVEWPPSPWRLLRAFLATGYTKLHWPADGPPAVARSLLDKLASTLPSYRLPCAVGAHSRHYMPMARFKNGREETTLVFDTWAGVGAGELGVRWAVELDSLERAELDRIVAALDYLGRSESWAEARLTVDDHGDGFDVRPDASGADAPGPGWEQVGLLAPVPPDRYTGWRSQVLAEALAAIPAIGTTGKPVTAAQHRKRTHELEQAHPANLLACLQVETGWLRRLGWSQPPGSQKVFYWRRADALQVAPARAPQRELPRAEPVQFMLLALASASGRRNVLPRVERALPQAELLHRALVAQAGRIAGHCAVLSGCDQRRRPLNGPHQHAHLLLLDLDGDACLDHVLVWAPMGLDAHAQAAVRAVRRTWTKGGIEPLRLALAGAGNNWQSFATVPAPYAQALQETVGASRAWVSATPFVPPRHIKTKGRNSLENQVHAELASRGLPAPSAIEWLDPKQDEHARRLRHHVRARRPGPLPPADLGLALRIQFDAPVRGPLCLGYASHYGLGRFVHCQTVS